MSKSYSQTSRDRLAFNVLIAIPVIAVLVLIRHYQAPPGEVPPR